MAEVKTDTASHADRKKHRSPAYPAISLKQAIDRADQFFQHERRNAASIPAAASHWGYGLKSSGLLTTAAALKSFGLMDEIEGASGASRTLRLSELGLLIVLDKRPESAERAAAIKRAALMPKIHSELWRRYNGQLPSDVELRHRLIFDHWKFNENTVDDFIREFRQTISFAKLAESDTISTDDEDREEEQKPPTPYVGDFVQWESQGQLQFKEPKQIKGFSDDGQWAFIEGSATGVPVKELTVTDPPVDTSTPIPGLKGNAVTPPPSPFPPDPVKPLASNRQDVFSLAEGPATFQWPATLSAESFQDLSAWLEILKRKIGRSVPFKATKRDVIAKLRAGWKIYGDPESDTPCSLIDPSQSSVDWGPVLPVEMLRELLEDGILAQNQGNGARYFNLA
jgi:hypothetical protein